MTIIASARRVGRSNAHGSPARWVDSREARESTEGLETRKEPRSRGAPGISVQCEGEFCGTIGPVGQEVCREEEALFSRAITSVLQQVAGGVPTGDAVAKSGSLSKRSIAGRNTRSLTASHRRLGRVAVNVLALLSLTTDAVLIFY